ncbi:MAG: hypothetical protein ACYSTT_22130, partial [Planctomycetota bacterium]
KKHYSRPAYLIARFLVALFFAVRLPVWLARAFIRPAARNEAAIKMKAYSNGVVSALLGKVYSEKF